MSKAKKDDRVRALSIRLPVGLHDSVKSEADAERRSFNAQVLYLIEKAMNSGAAR